MAARGRISIVSFGSLQDAIALADVNGGSVKIKGRLPFASTWSASHSSLRTSSSTCLMDWVAKVLAVLVNCPPLEGAAVATGSRGCLRWWRTRNGGLKGRLNRISSRS
jgi:hypothetical protein